MATDPVICCLPNHRRKEWAPHPRSKSNERSAPTASSLTPLAMSRLAERLRRRLALAERQKIVSEQKRADSSGKRRLSLIHI